MLESVFATLDETDTQFYVHAPTESSLPSWFETHNVAVTHKPLNTPVPEPFVTIESGDSVVGTLTIAQLDDLLTPPISKPGDDAMVSEGYQVLFDVLDSAVFTALDRAQLLTVSREIEDRAYRIGQGTLRVCFQTFSTFESQVDIYRQLATDTDLDIHIYGVDDWDPPAIEGITYHDISGEDLDLYWLLTFDSGTADGDACGLFARQDGDTYTGYWTDDRDIIGRIDTELVATVDESSIVAD
jgi:hypothetical protein